MKWANQALGFRFLSQFITLILFAWTNGKDPETMQYELNLAPETRDYYGILALFNFIGLPFDIVYASIMNLAKDGNTEAFADQAGIQAYAIATAIISGLGSLFGLVFNMVWQLALWIDDLKHLDLSNTDMWGVMRITFINFFDNVFYEGFKPAIFFIPVYSMFALALPYAFYVYDVSN